MSSILYLALTISTLNDGLGSCHYEQQKVVVIIVMVTIVQKHGIRPSVNFEKVIDVCCGRLEQQAYLLS